MPKKRKSGWKKWVFILIVLVGTMYFYRWWRTPVETTLVYRTATVDKGDIQQVVTASGTLEPVVFVEVGTEVSGTLREINVDFNSVVTNLQVLAQLDPRTFENNLRQATAEVASAAASRELARIEARRAEDLFREALISKSEYDTEVAELQRAEATMQIREATRDKNQVDLDRTTIYSPIDGVVISRNVEVGQTVAASLNAPTLFLIANDLAKMHIHAAISEADIGGVAEGQDVEFTVDAFPMTKMEGLVEQVRNAAVTNQNVISYTTVIEVDNPDFKLKPGMTANVSVTLAERKDVIKVPNAAFRFRPPEGAVIEGAPKQENSDGETELTQGGEGRRGRGGGGRGGGGGDSERRAQFMARFDKNGDGQIDESERAAMRQQFGGGGGGGRGGGGGFGGGGRPQRPAASASNEPTVQNVYVLTEKADELAGNVEVLKLTEVKAGISDGAFTEILSGLTEGDVLAVGTETLDSGALGASGSNNPFAPSFGRGRSRSSSSSSSSGGGRR